MHIKELIPLISVIVHPIAVLWVLNISNSLFSYSNSKEEDMITGKVSSTPKNAYLIASKDWRFCKILFDKYEVFITFLISPGLVSPLEGNKERL